MIYIYICRLQCGGAMFAGHHLVLIPYASTIATIVTKLSWLVIPLEVSKVSIQQLYGMI